MPTKQQLINKIADLDFWLKANHSHADYQKILQDKKDLEHQLIQKGKDERERHN